MLQLKADLAAAEGRIEAAAADWATLRNEHSALQREAAAAADALTLAQMDNDRLRLQCRELSDRLAAADAAAGARYQAQITTLQSKLATALEELRRSGEEQQNVMEIARSAIALKVWRNGWYCSLFTSRLLSWNAAPYVHLHPCIHDWQHPTSTCHAALAIPCFASVTVTQESVAEDLRSLERARAASGAAVAHAEFASQMVARHLDAALAAPAGARRSDASDDEPSTGGQCPSAGGVETGATPTKGKKGKRARAKSAGPTPRRSDGGAARRGSAAGEQGTPGKAPRTPGAVSDTPVDWDRVRCAFQQNNSTSAFVVRSTCWNEAPDFQTSLPDLLPDFTSRHRASTAECLVCNLSAAGPLTRRCWTCCSA